MSEVASPEVASPEAGDRRAPRRLLLIAVVAGLVLRIGLLAVLGTSHSPMSEFGVIGANLSRGHGFTYFASFSDLHVIPAADVGDGVKPAADRGFDRPTSFTGDPLPSAYMPPVYPAIAAIADDLTSTRAGEIRVLQLVNLALFVLLAWTLYLLGDALAGPDVGALAVVGAAFFPSLMYMTTQVSASNVYLPAECAMLVLAIRTLREPTRMRLVVATGAMVGVVGLLRPEGIVLGALIALMIVLAGRRHGQRLGAALKPAVVVVVVAAIPIGMWLVRNTRTFGTPVLTVTSQSGFVLWAGNHDGASGSGKTLSHGKAAQAREDALFERAAALPPGPTYELRRDRLFRDEAVKWITHHPVSFAAGIAKKTVLLGVVDPDDRRSLNPGYVVSWLVLVVLAVAGARRIDWRRPEWRLVAAYALLSFFVPVAFVVLPRYRVPVEMVLLIPAACFVSRHAWYGRFRSALAAWRPPAGERSATRV